MEQPHAPGPAQAQPSPAAQHRDSLLCASLGRRLTMAGVCLLGLWLVVGWSMR